MFHACPLPEEGHIYGYERAVFVVYGIQGAHRDAGYVPPGARTEEISDSIIPRGLGCEEIKVPSDNGHSLSGVFVSGASRSTNPSESPETLFFYLQGSNSPPRHTWSVPAEQRLMPQGMQETHFIVFQFSRLYSITPPSEPGPA